MVEIISLSKARKQKARASKEAQAEQNRALFGRTKGEKLKQQAEQRLAATRIDGHKIED